MVVVIESFQSALPPSKTDVKWWMGMPGKFPWSSLRWLLGSASKTHTRPPGRSQLTPRGIRVCGAANKAEENAAPTSSHPQTTEGAAKLTPGSQSHLCCSPSPCSCLRTAAATAHFPVPAEKPWAPAEMLQLYMTFPVPLPSFTFLSYLFSGLPLPELWQVLPVGKKSGK